MARRTRDSGRSDDRGVSNVVGFVFIFSFLILGFTIYQGMIVPDQNRQAEFDHNQDVQAQMQDLRNAIQNAARGTDQSATVKLGAEYPQRTFSENLAISSGNLKTTSLGSGILIRNVTPIDGETGDYFNETSPTVGPLETRTLQYLPNYARYTSPPTTIYENTVAYNRFGDGRNLTLTDQAIVDGRRITLVALNGSLSEASDRSVTVDAEAISEGEPIAVTNATDTKVNLTLPTKLSVDEWRDLLADQMDTAGSDEKYVESVNDTGPNQVSILLEANVTYDLRLAKVGVGNEKAPQEAHYATDVAGDDTSIAEGGSKKLVVEVRDRFNTPVSNVTVESTIETSAGSGDTVTPASAVTDDQGRAEFTYTSPGDVDDPQDADIWLSFGPGTVDRQNVTFDVEVLDADGSGGGSCGEDPGTGGEDPWCASSPTTTVSQPGGMITGIGSTSHLNLTDPSFSSIRPTDEDVRTASERFRLVFVIEKDVSVTSGTKRYLFAVPKDPQGFDQDLDNAGTTVQSRVVKLYVDSNHNTDGSAWTEKVSGQIKQSDLDSWYDGAFTIDLLDGSHYSGSVQGDLDDVKDFMDNNQVRIYIVDMDGRVDLTVD